MSEHDPLLQTATTVLLGDPGASLGAVARAAGISRTSLHSRFPARVDLLVALANNAMDLVEDALARADLDPEQPFDRVAERVVAAMLPLGSRVAFLLRERSLDPVEAVTARYEQVTSAPLERWLAAAQVRGDLAADVPPGWAAASLLSSITTAWDLIADGWLAPRQAPPLVLRTFLHGTAPR